MEVEMSIAIRLAIEEDIPVLEELFLEFSSWNLQRSETLLKAIKDPNGELLVAESNGQVVAFLHQIFFIDPLHAGLNSDITSLFVKEGCRRKGIASSLVEKAVENAKRRNVIEIHVTTRESNRTAMELYEKLGFTKEGILFERNP
ncbi:GNAT family N-acetyltransferase [Candidatus Bathyarchaeota archaeon]|nr:GNAT family N-acetyltransferase [Candidatus Bathyarchaeota archaeon]